MNHVLLKKRYVNNVYPGIMFIFYYFWYTFLYLLEPKYPMTIVWTKDHWGSPEDLLTSGMVLIQILL